MHVNGKGVNGANTDHAVQYLGKQTVAVQHGVKDCKACFNMHNLNRQHEDSGSVTFVDSTT